MDLIQIVVLSIVQGLTEFLPISSSAHLILASKFFGWQDQGILFDMKNRAATTVTTTANTILSFRCHKSTVVMLLVKKSTTR